MPEQIERQTPPEKENHNPLTPETSRMIVGAMIPEMLSPIGILSPEQTQKFKTEVAGITPDKLHASAIADLAGAERKQEHDTYDGWSNRMKTWFDNQNVDTKRAIKGTFAGLGIEVNDHMEQAQLDKLFDEYLSMEGSPEEYQNRYDKFVKGFVHEFEHEGRTVDRNGLAERVETMKPLLSSFGRGDMVEVIDAHINALGFISQDDETKRVQAEEVITGAGKGLTNNDSIRGFTKLHDKIFADQNRQPRLPARNEDETPTEVIRQPKTETEIAQLMHDAQEKLGRPLNDIEKMHINLTGDIDTIDRVDIEDFYRKLVSAQNNTLEHGEFKSTTQRLEELEEKGDAITKEDKEEYQTLLASLGPAQIAITSPEELDLFAVRVGANEETKRAILDNYNNFDTKPDKPEDSTTAFSFIFVTDDSGKSIPHLFSASYVPTEQVTRQREAIEAQRREREAIDKSITPELAQQNSEHFKKLILDNLELYSQYGKLAWEYALQNGIVTTDDLEINSETWNSSSDSSTGIKLGTAAFPIEQSENIMFENRRFSYPQQVAYRLIHELCHKLNFTTFQLDPEFQELMQKTFISREQTGEGFSALGSTFHYEKQGQVVQGREDLVEMVTMFLNDPGYLDRFLTFLTDTNPENEQLRQKLKLRKIEPEIAQKIFTTINAAVARGIGDQPSEPSHPAETITALTEDEQQANLEKEAPELLEALLPAELERMLPDGFNRYFLGINQTGGVQSIDEATALLKHYKGIDMAGYSSFGQRFDLMDHQYLKGGKWTRDFYGPIHGHYGENIGRFVAVFPVDETKDTDMTPAEIAMEGYERYSKDHPDYPYPKDLLIKGGGTGEREGTAVNDKYIAGFIDVQGHFHRNPGFMKDTTEEAS